MHGDEDTPHRGAVSDTARNPIVAAIDSKLSDEQVADLASANIIVATPQALLLFQDAALRALVNMCSHLMIDEAHHVAAASWNRIKTAFIGKPCIQFTATPFREDGLALAGKIIYNYPLRDAQLDGYFKGIEFYPVREYNLKLSDQAIADKAVKLLRADLKAGYNHLMMVRANGRLRPAPNGGYESIAAGLTHRLKTHVFCKRRASSRTVSR